MYVNDFVLLSTTISLCALVLPTIRGILFETAKSTSGEDSGIERQTMMNSFEETEDPPWNYSDVEAWRINYPSCGGRRQSPVDIDFSQTVPSNADTNPMFSNLRYVGYENIPEDMTITNNGHTSNRDYLDRLPYPRKLKSHNQRSIKIVKKNKFTSVEDFFIHQPEIRALLLLLL